MIPLEANLAARLPSTVTAARAAAENSHRRRVGTEVAIAGPTRRPRGAGIGWTRREASRPRATKPATTASATGSSRAWTAESARAGPRRTVFTRARFAHGKRASFERLLVEAADGFFRDATIQVIHEGEPPRATRFPVDGKNDL